MVCVVMASTVIAFILMARASRHVTCSPCRQMCATPSYGLYSYSLYSYGLYSYGLHSYGLHSYGLYSYGLCRYPLYSYGLDTRTVHRDGLEIHANGTVRARAPSVRPEGSVPRAPIHPGRVICACRHDPKKCRTGCVESIPPGKWTWM